MIEIRLATIEDVPFLPAIESAAGKLFSQFEFTANLPDTTMPLEKLYESAKNNLLWVAVPPNGKPIGFAQAYMLDGSLHLQEVDIHPDYGRQGIGARMVRVVCDWARASGISAVTLTTFRDIPWNAPFYQKLGFNILEPEELTPPLLRLVEEEERHGLKRELRVVMRYEIGG